MKPQKRFIATFAAPLLLGIALTSCNAGDNPSANAEDISVDAPTGLKYEYTQANEVRLLWSAAANAHLYQLTVGNKSYTVINTYHLLTDALPYSTEYTWSVRTGKKLASDTAYSAWATATFVTPPSPVAPRPPAADSLLAQFKGTWHADSASISATIGALPLPIDSLKPDNIDAGLLTIAIDEDEKSKDTVFLSVVGIDEFLSIENRQLNRIAMTVDSRAETIYGEVPLNPENNTQTQNFDPPIPLAELGVGLPGTPIIPGTENPPIDNIAISAITLRFTRVDISGKLENEEATKAQYELKVSATIAVATTADSMIDMLINTYLQTQPIAVTLKAYCTK